MFKAFIKEREQRVNASARIKRSVSEFIEELHSSKGSRIEHVGEFMWEVEYKEWAQTSKAGKLTLQERKANWKKWEKDLTVPRDNDGPQRSLRIWARAADRMTQLEEIFKNKSLQRTEKINKNASVEQLRRKLATVFSDDSQKGTGLADVQGSDFVNFPALQDKAAKAMTGNGTSSVLDGCLLGPDLGDIMRVARFKKRQISEGVDWPRKAGKAQIDDVEGTDDDKVAPKREMQKLK